MAAVALVSATQVSARERYEDESRFPMSVHNIRAFKGLTDNNRPATFVEVPLANVDNVEAYYCDLYGKMKARRRGSSTKITVTKWVRSMKIELDQENKVLFQFERGNFGYGFVPVRGTVKADANCIPESEYTEEIPVECNPVVVVNGKNTTPGQSDDPRVKPCDWTCEADLDDPTRCADIEIPWE